MSLAGLQFIDKLVVVYVFGPPRMSKRRLLNQLSVSL